MISPLSRLASSSASLLLPAPVGPEITMTFCLASELGTEQVVAENRRRQAKRDRVLRRRGSIGERRGRRQQVRRLHAPPLNMVEEVLFASVVTSGTEQMVREGTDEPALEMLICWNFFSFL